MRDNALALRVSRVPVHLRGSRVIALAPLRRLRMGRISNRCLAFMFGDGFCYVCKRSGRISYGKFLFCNSSGIVGLTLSTKRSSGLRSVIHVFQRRSIVRSGLRRRVLQVILGHFVVAYAHVTHRHFKIKRRGRGAFSVVQRCCMLISQRFGRGGRIRSCTSVLYHSPGALSGLFSAYKLPSPLQIVRSHVRTRTVELLLCARGDTGRVDSVLNFRSLSTFDHFFGGVANRDISSCQGEIGQRRLPAITRWLPFHA